MRPDWCFLAPGDQLHVNRLRYAKRLVQHCPGLVYCGIFCTTSVMLQILGLGHSVPHWHGWYSAMVLPNCPHLRPTWRSGGPWLLLLTGGMVFITRAKAACLAYRRAVAQELVREKGIENQLLRDDALAELDAAKPPIEPWAREKCEMVFASRKALAVHATKAHNYRV